MAAFKDYENYDGLGLAKLIKNKEVKPEEVLEAAIEKIEHLNPKLNAVITKTFEEAKNSLNKHLPDGMFKGVPILFKDVLQMCKGIRYTMGSKLLKDFIPEIDSEMVKRIKESGVIVLGKTNVPEFGLMGTTEPTYFKATKNPWDLKRSPGGSSGGSAAAVASRMVPIAGGNDGGGSIRIPSACCGVFGLKPSRGRTPNGPLNGEVWMGLVVEHVITRSVRDSAAMLDILSKPDIGSPYIIESQKESYLETIKTPPKTLKIAFNTESPYGGKVHEACKKAVINTAKILQDMGYTVEEASPKEINFHELSESYIVAMFGEVKNFLVELEKTLNKKISQSDIEISSWILAKIGEFVPIWKMSWAKHVWDTAARKMGEFHQKYDIYMTPTMADLPAKLGELLPKTTEKLALKLISSLNMGKLLSLDQIIEKVAYRQLHKVPFTQLANQTGQPAMSVPLFWTKSNLPIGVHFMTAFGREDILLKLAAQLEKAKPWKDKKPTKI